MIFGFDGKMSFSDFREKNVIFQVLAKMCFLVSVIGRKSDYDSDMKL